MYRIHYNVETRSEDILLFSNFSKNSLASVAGFPFAVLITASKSMPAEILSEARS